MSLQQHRRGGLFVLHRRDLQTPFSENNRLERSCWNDRSGRLLCWFSYWQGNHPETVSGPNPDLTTAIVFIDFL